MHHSGSYWVTQIGAHLGDAWLWVLIAGWKLRQAHRAPYAAVYAPRIYAWLASLVAAAGVTLVVKQHVRRPRPGTGAFLYGGGPDVYSFPSGHGLRLGVVLVWANQLWPGCRPWAWLVALWVCASRIRLGIHYLGDVVAGLALGALVGQCFRTGYSVLRLKALNVRRKA
jgi:membrane-associated phospholipid phosphatase